MMSKPLMTANGKPPVYSLSPSLSLTLSFSLSLSPVLSLSLSLVLSLSLSLVLLLFLSLPLSLYVYIFLPTPLLSLPISLAQEANWELNTERAGLIVVLIFFLFVMIVKLTQKRGLRLQSQWCIHYVSCLYDYNGHGFVFNIYKCLVSFDNFTAG